MENGILVRVVRGDLATLHAGGCVVPQFGDHGAETGVAGRLISSDCYDAVAEYDKICCHKLPFGYAVAVPTESEKFQRLIHVVALDLPADNKEEAFRLTQLATYSALAEAEKNGITQVVMPALGTGDKEPLRYSASGAAMLSAIASYPAKTIREVTIAIWKSDGAFRYFCRGGEEYLRFMDPSLPQEYRAMIEKIMLSRS